MLMTSSESCDSFVEGEFKKLREDRKSILLLDGGTGEELFRRGVPDDRKIWSATAVVNSEYHECLQKVHQSFIHAGSNAITTNSYGIVPGVGFSEDDIKKYVADAGHLARKSVNVHSSEEEGNNSAADIAHDKSRVLVMGSLGPLLESYRPDRLMSHKEGVKIYKLMADALLPSVDCYIAETMSSYEESTQVVEAVGSKRPLLVSYTLNSKGLLRSGQFPTKIIKQLKIFSEEHNTKILGILFNCSEPEAITKALKSIRDDPSLEDIILGAYANRLTPIPEDWSLAESDAAQELRSDITPEQYWTDFVSKWSGEYNVQLIGGCCGITPEHINYLKNQILNRN